jgi:hypothetical protein
LLVAAVSGSLMSGMAGRSGLNILLMPDIHFLLLADA